MSVIFDVTISKGEAVGTELPPAKFCSEYARMSLNILDNIMEFVHSSAKGRQR